MRALSFLLLFAHVLLCDAQDARCTLRISGRVIDDHDHTPLAFATVAVPATGYAVACDEQGRFTMEGLCPGRITLRVSHVGCEPAERNVKLGADMDIELRLEHHVEELKEHEVARRRPDENVGQAADEIDRAEMERSMGRTMAEMLATLPGVTTLNSGPTIGKPVIHGLYGSRIVTLNQGVRQEDQQWGTEHAPNLDPFSSDRLTIVKGAASVQYGADALGGVIMTEPVELPVEAGLRGDVRLFGELNGRGGGANAELEGGVKNRRGFGWRLQGGGRYLGDSEAPDYVLSNTGVRESGASAALGIQRLRYGANVYYSWFARELGIMRASHIGNLTDLENAIDSGEPWVVDDFTYAIDAPRQTVQHHLLKTEASWRPGDREQLVATYAYQADDRQEYDIRRGDRSDTPAIDLFLTTHTGDLVLKHWIGARMHGKVGVNGVWQDNYNVPGTGIRPLIPNYTKQTGGMFLVEHYPIGERLELEAGARFEAAELHVVKYDLNDVLFRPEHSFTNHAIAFGANWNVKDSLRLRFNLSSAFRPPNVSELYSEGLHHGAAAIERGDPTLGSERSTMGSVDLESAWLAGKLTVDATLYADRITDYIYLRPDGYELTIRGAFPVFYHTATDALLIGGDASLQYHFTSHWSLRSRWSVVRGSDQGNNGPLFLMPANRTENALVFERPSLGAGRSLSCVLTSTYVFEQVRVPEGVDFTDPPPAYHLLGLSADIVRPLWHNELRFGIQATNLFNTTYRDHLDRFRYYADARGVDLTIWMRYSFGKR